MNVQPITLSIVIVTWNGKQFAWECLDSLRIYQNDPNIEIFVVDNASSDGTTAMVEQEFPWVRLIRNSVNLGFSKANNIGMAAGSGKYVCLVNSDVKIPSGCLEKMHEYMERNSSVGMVGPQMLCPNGLIGRSYMRFPTVWRGMCNAFGLHRVFRNSSLLSGIMMPEFNNSETTEVDVLNGWFLMVRQAALEQVGMLDDQFFMYGEDIDWSYRFHKANWKRVYLAAARAFHYGGASSSATPARFYIEMKRANFQLYRKNHGSYGALAYVIVTCLHEIIRVVGYSFLSVFWRSKRSRAIQKIERSLACIRWLVSQGHQTGRKAL